MILTFSFAFFLFIYLVFFLIVSFAYLFVDLTRESFLY